MIRPSNTTELTAALQLPSLKSQKKVCVPTMGALHAGHIELIRHARNIAGEAGCVIVTLFVNPTQFDKPEDLENYPQTLNQDIKTCEKEGVDILFTPSADSIYYDDHSIIINENSLSKQLCGQTRPGHFDGVCTIVLKLLNITQADSAVFGKKDYQQLAIIRRLVRDLNISVQIEGVDTVREPSGLALSSRNARLTHEQREDAARLRQALLLAKQAYQNGETSTAPLIQIAQDKIEASSLAIKIDYLELLDAVSLKPINSVDQPAIIAAAVFYDNVRLIDNIEIG